MTIFVDQGFPSIVAGDFNDIGRLEEKRGGRLFIESTGSREFEEFLHSNGLWTSALLARDLLSVIISLEEPEFRKESTKSL